MCSSSPIKIDNSSFDTLRVSGLFCFKNVTSAHTEPFEACAEPAEAYERISNTEQKLIDKEVV